MLLIFCLFNFVQENIGALMSILGDHMGALSKDDLNTYHSQIVSFFLVALDYRGKHIEVGVKIQ